MLHGHRCSVYLLYVKLQDVTMGECTSVWKVFYQVKLKSLCDENWDESESLVEIENDRNLCAYVTHVRQTTMLQPHDAKVAFFSEQ